MVLVFCALAGVSIHRIPTCWAYNAPAEVSREVRNTGGKCFWHWPSRLL